MWAESPIPPSRTPWVLIGTSLSSGITCSGRASACSRYPRSCWSVGKCGSKPRMNVRGSLNVSTHRLRFAVDDCCRSAMAVRLGVSNPSAQTVHDVRVYVDVLRAGAPVEDRVLQWAGDVFPALDIHPAPITRHHHTQWVASVGDNDGEFWLTFGYP